MSQNGDADEEQASLLSVKSIKASPDTLSKLVKRLRALTLTLLPVEVDPASISEPTSRIITPQVISAYRAAAGDFVEALPYCLLRTRAGFIWDANHNAADYDENYGRAIACEVLARRIVHLAPPDRLMSLMSTRFKHVEADGNESDMASALELAIDSHCTIFLSSTEAQDVVIKLWNGDLIQKNNDNHDIDYVHYDDERDPGFWGHLDPSRLSVPRYQNFYRIVVWFIFLVVYSQSVREPLDKMDPNHISVDVWEIVLYVLALAFCIEDIIKWYKLFRFVTWRAFGFWDIVSFMTDSLLATAFVLRMIGLGANQDRMAVVRLKSFQVLSFVSPLICMELVTVFDGYKYVGTMTICVARMLQESGIFFALLSVLGLGFFQGLYALDAADGETESPSVVVNVLVQALLQSPNYDKFATSPAGLTLYYFWNVVTAVILLNVLISLFSSAYSDVIDDAEAEYLAFFASKTVGMIRAPDEYVYPAPFNLLELFLVAPFEIIPKVSLSQKAYAALNRYVMTIVFFLPVASIALFEVTVRSPSSRSGTWMRSWFRGADEDDGDDPADRDPDVSDTEHHLKISRVPFAELVKVFPNTEQSSEATILKEVRELRGMVEVLTRRLEESGKI
ncbi:hypothetical protein PLICRDRAFT_33792 [Plicaturopsis crispa FD-325 SS-3]|nr:hypothetical protein PLICRDRAFT_33792 [Plicaturopsis crispa FD-325 SS-3]